MGRDAETMGPQPAQTFEVITLFGDALRAFLEAGLMGKALASGTVAVHCTDPRDFSEDRHRTVDDAPFGGGAGMVMKPGPVVAALEQVRARRGPVHTLLVTPSAPRFDQAAARRLAALPRVAILCGRYEGIDDRVREGWVDECVSLGDFVLNGGEVAALAIIEAVARLQPGVLGNPESTVAESFGEAQVWGGGLEHPQYTRPAVFRGVAVPPVLLGGDHQRVARWRRQLSALRTHRLRPELRPPGDEAAGPGLGTGVAVHVVLAALPSPADEGPLLTMASRAGVTLWFVEPEGMTPPETPGLRSGAGGGGELRPPRDGGGSGRLRAGDRGRRALRRYLRKVHGGEPRWVGARLRSPAAQAPVARDGGELRLLLRAGAADPPTPAGPDVASGPAASPQPAVVVDLSALHDGEDDVAPPRVADIALLDADDPASGPTEGLAIGGVMIESSQPRSAQLPTPRPPAASAPSADDAPKPGQGGLEPPLALRLLLSRLDLPSGVPRENPP